MLLGGFERGSVVGISAEDEDGVGVTVSLLCLLCVNLWRGSLHSLLFTSHTVTSLQDTDLCHDSLGYKC